MKNFTFYFLLVFFLYGVQTGTAQEKKAPSEDQDELAPLVDIKEISDDNKNLSINEPSYIFGFQLRPPYAWLKVRQSQLLTVRYCTQPTTDGNDALASLLYECDSKDLETAPLLPIAVTSKWSVNGIEGGNSIVGKIIDKGKGEAMYTAPAQKPDLESIQVSVEIETKDQGKTLLVTNITILDDLRVYRGNIQINFSDVNGFWRAFGEIAFKETYPNSDSFKSIGGWLEVLIESEGIIPFRDRLLLVGTMNLDLPIDGKHQIVLGAEQFELTTKITGQKVQVALLSMLVPCDYGINDEKNRVLSGDYSCGRMNYKWELTRQ